MNEYQITNEEFHDEEGLVELIRCFGDFEAFDCYYGKSLRFNIDLKTLMGRKDLCEELGWGELWLKFMKEGIEAEIQKRTLRIPSGSTGIRKMSKRVPRLPELP